MSNRQSDVRDHRQSSSSSWNNQGGGRHHHPISRNNDRPRYHKNDDRSSQEYRSFNAASFPSTNHHRKGPPPPQYRLSPPPRDSQQPHPDLSSSSYPDPPGNSQDPAAPARSTGRPSATSLEYDHQNHNHLESLSVHNLVELQTWESRKGLSQDYDHTRPGYELQRQRRRHQQHTQHHPPPHNNSHTSPTEEDHPAAQHYWQEPSPPKRPRRNDDISHHWRSEGYDLHEDRRHSTHAPPPRAQGREAHPPPPGRYHHHHQAPNHGRPFANSSGRPPSPPWQEVPARRRRQASPRSRQKKGLDEPPPPPICPVVPNDVNTQFEPFLLLLVGIPGSGKSTFASSLEQALPWKYVRINQDTLGTRQSCEAAARQALQQHKCPVIDRCNFNIKQRQPFLDVAKECSVPVDCVVFNYSLDTCVARCQQRKAHETIVPAQAPAICQRMMRGFLPPLPTRVNREGFRALREIKDLEASNDLVMEYVNC